MNIEERNELVKYRLSKAKNTIDEVEILLENKLWNTALNRLYYASYYAVIALLVNNEIQVQTHAGVRQMFGLHFIKTGLIDKKLGRIFSELFDKRHTGDYDDFIEITFDDVIELVQPSKDLILAIEKLIKYN